MITQNLTGLQKAYLKVNPNSFQPVFNVRWERKVQDLRILSLISRGLPHESVSPASDLLSATRQLQSKELSTTTSPTSDKSEGCVRFFLMWLPLASYQAYHLTPRRFACVAATRTAITQGFETLKSAFGIIAFNGQLPLTLC